MTPRHDPSTHMRLSERLRTLAEKARGLPFGADDAAIRELVDVGELTVALEILCDQLYEYDVHLSPGDCEALRALVQELGVTRRSAELLLRANC